MRYRSKKLVLPGSKGLDYSAWILGWQDPVVWSQSALTFKSEIFDDLGFGRVNPLHSYQIRATRKPVNIKAERWPGKYEGEVSIANSHMSAGYLIENTLQDLGAWATKGAACARTIDPVYDAAVVVGELTEAYQIVTGLTTIVATIKRAARGRRDAIDRIDDVLKGIGDTGIYTVFGIVPTVKAVTTLQGVMDRLDSAVRKALNNNDEWQHITCELLKTSKTTNQSGSGGCWPEGLVSAWVVKNRYDKTIVNEEHIWFETDIKYVLPANELKFNSEALRRRLFGGVPNGRVLYELFPYSWLLDWFSSAGAMVSNSMDHTLYRWRNPCIMHESKRDMSITGALTYYTKGGSQETARPTGRVRTTVKRRSGYEFGKFGITLGELNNYQVTVGLFFAAR